MSPGDQRSSPVWWFPAAGYGVAAMAALRSLSPEAWPARGVFGAFTWTAWFMTSGVMLTLLLLSASTAAGRVCVRGRALVAALAFGVLALASYTVARRSRRSSETRQSLWRRPWPCWGPCGP